MDWSHEKKIILDLLHKKDVILQRALSLEKSRSSRVCQRKSGIFNPHRVGVLPPRTSKIGALGHIRSRQDSVKQSGFIILDEINAAFVGA